MPKKKGRAVTANVKKKGASPPPQKQAVAIAMSAAGRSPLGSRSKT